MRRIVTTRILVLAIIVASIGVAVVAAETILEVSKYRGAIALRKAVAARNGRPFDARSIPTVIQESRGTAEPLVPSANPRTLVEHAQPGTDPSLAYTSDILPIGGISHRATLQMCNEDGRYHTYVSDRYGFANADAAWGDNHPQLMLVGDSFMQGYCVSADSDVASFLGHDRPHTVTVGAGGSGPLAELAAVTEYAVATSAPIVVWSYFENDLDDLLVERNAPLLMQYLDPRVHQDLIDKQALIDSVLSSWVARVYSSGRARDFILDPPTLRQIVTLHTLRQAVSQRRQQPPDQRDLVPLFAKALREAASRINAYGGRLVFVFLPEWERFYAPASLVGDAARPEVLAVVREIGLPIIDLTPAFASHPQREALFAKGTLAPAHYSALGYALTAATISRGLDSLHLNSAR